MSCPEFFYFIRPALDAIAEKPNAHWSEIAEVVADKLKLKSADREELVASGNKTKFEDRVQWAQAYLRQAKLIESSGRGKNAITAHGREYLTRAPDVIRRSDLEEFDEFKAFRGSETKPPRISKGSSVAVAALPLIEATPLETMNEAHESIRTELARSLSDRLRAVSPARFERLIVELMLRLGYGGPRSDAGQTLGRTGDGGIDGVIRQDRLGLDNIYLQAKRWTGNNVGTQEINSFIGALTTRGATKGVLITTSSFSESAKRVAAGAPHLKLSLIDGNQLARLMIDHDLGVALEARFDVKRVDSDYFAEE